MRLAGFIFSFAITFSCSHGLGFPFNINQGNPWAINSMQFPQMQVPNFEIPEIPDAEMMANEGANEAEQMMGNDEPDFLSNFRMPKFSFRNMKDGKNVKSNNLTTEKDGYTIKMYNQSGPGFVSFVEEIVSKPSNKSNTTKGEMESASVVSENFGGKMFPGWKMLAMPKQAKFNKQCHRRKNCKPNQFCDPYSRTCENQVPEGGLCSGKNQCSGKNICVWGKCQNSVQGALGTFCQTDKDCHGKAFCNNETRRLHPVCSPRLPEGAPCEEIGLLDLLTNLGHKPRSSVCETGLKCAMVGDDGRFKICVNESYVENVKDKKEGSADGKNQSESNGSQNSNQSENNKDSDDDKEDTDAKDKEKDSETDGAKDKEKDSESNDSESNDSESKDSEKEASGDDNGLNQDQSIPIKPGPKENKGEKKGGKKGGKKSHSKKHHKKE